MAFICSFIYLRVFTCNHKARRSAGLERAGAMLAGCVGAAGPSCGLGQWIPIVGGVNVRLDLPSGTSARAPLCVGADGTITSWLGVPRARVGHGVKTKGVVKKRNKEQRSAPALWSKDSCESYATDKTRTNDGSPPALEGGGRGPGF